MGLPELWHMDGDALDLTAAAERLAPGLKPDFLRTRGGLLFKSCLVDGAYHFGAIPWVWQGERGRHYDISLPPPEERHLIGTITAYGELSLLFRNPDIDDEDRKAYREAAGALAVLFSAARSDASWPFDGITRQLFEAAQLWKPAPKVLDELDPGASSPD